jgi:hypothetical protein
LKNRLQALEARFENLEASRTDTSNNPLSWLLFGGAGLGVMLAGRSRRKK